MSIVCLQPRSSGPQCVTSRLPSRSLWHLGSLFWTFLHNLTFCQVPIGFMDSNLWKPISSIFRQFAYFHPGAPIFHPPLFAPPPFLYAPHLQTDSALFELVHVSSFTFSPPLILSFRASKSKRYKMAKFSCLFLGGSQPPQPPRKKLKVCKDRRNNKEKRIAFAA